MVKAKKNVESLEKRSGEASPEVPAVEKRLCVPTGSTLLNCALTDDPNGGWVVGKMVNIIGDSSSGKTILALSCLAEASMLPAFDNYSFILDDAEWANEFDMSRLFGKRMAERIEPPRRDADTDEPLHSTTVQEFKLNVMSRLKSGKPFIYVLDSFDAISTDSELARVEAELEVHEGGKAKVPGSMGMEKAKQASETLRIITSSIEKSDSLLIIISQTRDNTDPMAFTKRTRAGGKALKFYATHEVWTSIQSRIQKEVEKIKRKIGVITEIDVKKNKITGKERDVTVKIYYDYGIDDMHSCFDLMVEANVWEVRKNSIVATGLGQDEIVGSREKIIQEIEKRGLHQEFRAVVGRTWQKIEDSLKLDRVPKYGDRL